MITTGFFKKNSTAVHVIFVVVYIGHQTLFIKFVQPICCANLKKKKTGNSEKNQLLKFYSPGPSRIAKNVSKK